MLTTPSDVPNIVKTGKKQLAITNGVEDGDNNGNTTLIAVPPSAAMLSDESVCSATYQTSRLTSWATPLASVTPERRDAPISAHARRRRKSFGYAERLAR